MIDLQDYLVAGQNADLRKAVAVEDTADNYPNELRNLLATPRLLHWVVDAAIEAIDPYLPEEYASVGTSVSFQHVAPTRLGMTVTVHAAIAAILGNEVLMDVSVWDEQGVIAKGTHQRTVILKDDLRRKIGERRLRPLKA